MTVLSDMIGKIDLSDAIELTTRALDLVNALAKSATAETAADVVRLIGAVYRAVVETAEEKITAADAHKALDALEAGIAKNDTEIDILIDDKFEEPTK